jgi:formate dehydrogenase iron-sulfur subunit
MPFQIAGNVKFGGLFETAFGMPLGELVEMSAAARPRAGR